MVAIYPDVDFTGATSLNELPDVKEIPTNFCISLFPSILKLSHYPWHSVGSSKQISYMQTCIQPKTHSLSHGINKSCDNTFNSEKDKTFLAGSGCHTSVKIIALLAMKSS